MHEIFCLQPQLSVHKWEIVQKSGACNNSIYLNYRSVIKNQRILGYSREPSFLNKLRREFVRHRCCPVSRAGKDKKKKTPKIGAKLRCQSN